MRSPLATFLAYVLVPTALASAQPRADEPRDFDQDREEFSEFWERGLTPNKKLYDRLLTQARAVAAERSSDARARARRMLTDAIKLAPERPEAHWELGLVHERDRKWKRCADTLTELYELAPNFQPNKSESALDTQLAECLAQSGDHRTAIRHLKRILARGKTPSHTHLMIGQSYMALGELQRAIEYFETAARTEGRGAVKSNFALAAAYDRDERNARSRSHLDRATARDPSLSSLASRSDIVPRADRYFYLGLGYSRKNIAWSLIYFRHYLEEAGATPWRARAQRHVSELSNDFQRQWPIEVTGSAKVDVAALRRTLRKKHGALQRCVADTPELLLRVKIKRVAKRVGPGGLIPGVTVLVDYAFGRETRVVERVVSCVDRVAAEITLPPLSGPSGSFAVVSVPVVKLTH